MSLFRVPRNSFLDEAIETATPKNKLKRHIRTTLFRNAYYLMASSAVNALGGFAFWMVAARCYSAEDVGLASALISAIALLALLSTLGLGFGLIRFLPEAGETASEIINSCFTIAVLASIVVGSVFLVGLGFWSPTLLFLWEQPIYAAFFLVFTVAWTLFALTDRVFTAKRVAKFTFIKNAISAVLKVPMPLLFAASFGAFGIFASAGLAMIAGLGIALIWFLPRVQENYSLRLAFRKEIVRDMMHYSLWNFFADLLWIAPTLLFPILVVNVLGAEMTAYFYIAWALASMAFIIPIALSSSLFAEGSHEEDRLSTDTKRALRMNLLILLPMIALLCTFGDKLLLIFGEAYAAEATTLLWMLALSALPLSINSLYLAVHRVKKNIPRLIIVPSAVAIISLGLSYPLMQELDLLGVGIAWLGGQGLVAVALFVPLLHQRLVRR